jgi:hypothetical protein
VRRYRLIDLFSGCGGMTRGFVDSGRFEPVFAVDFDHDAATTWVTAVLCVGGDRSSPPRQEGYAWVVHSDDLQTWLRTRPVARKVGAESALRGPARPSRRN